MKINLKGELNKKYEYLMNLSQNPSKRKLHQIVLKKQQAKMI